MLMENRKLNVTYYRLSLKDINKYGIFSDSIMNQRIINKSFADRMGITIDKEYIIGNTIEEKGLDEF